MNFRNYRDSNTNLPGVYFDPGLESSGEQTGGERPVRPGLGAGPCLLDQQAPTCRKCCCGCCWACVGCRGTGWELGKLGCSTACPISRTGVEALLLVLCTSAFRNTAWLCGYLFGFTWERENWLLRKRYDTNSMDSSGKIDKLDLIKMKNVHASKDTLHKVKRPLRKNICKSFS